ncbi:MAG: undecaprenyl-phosphate glucose phosphotransferase [Lachnospiraceae bacterium]|nr:undecaprenyl-phosphate glucose phosphotransferase [Lachnospiraceae bacterium]
MIRDNQRFFNRLHMVLDAVSIAAMYILSWWIRFSWMPQEEGIGVLSMEFYFMMLAFIIPGYLVLYAECGLYSPKRGTSSFFEFFNIVRANLIGAGIVMMLFYLFRVGDFSRIMLGIFLVLNILLCVLSRMLVRVLLQYIWKKGYNLKQILLVGYSRAAEAYIDRLNSHPQWGYQIRGILDDVVPRGVLYKGVKVLGDIDNLLYILPENRLDEIVITLPLIQYDRLERIVELCEKSGIYTKFVPDYGNVMPSNPQTEDLEGLFVTNIRYVPLTSSVNMFVKRVIDLLTAVVGIVVTSPIMLITAILIKLTSPGPVIYRQERIGFHNKPFMMYKFRSMKLQDPESEKKGWSNKNDSRVTPVGKFIRRTSIDELPQFFNILKGEMSLVGPRPERPQFVEKFREEIPRYMVKHQVRPGITGWAQVNGYRGDTSILRRIEYDIYYIENWSLGLDFKIMFLTVFKGFINKNAY